MKVFIVSPQGALLGTSVYVIEEGPRNVQSLARIENGRMVYEPVDESRDDQTPTLRFTPHEALAFFHAFAEALDQQGVKTDSDAKIAGTLEATRAHLADLRQLLDLEDVAK